MTGQARLATDLTPSSKAAIASASGGRRSPGGTRPTRRGRGRAGAVLALLAPRRGHGVGRGLEAAHVLALPGHLPVGEHRQLRGAPAHERAEAERAVDDRGGGEAVRAARGSWKKTCSAKPVVRRAEAAVVGEAGLGRRVARPDRAVADEQLRVRAHHREAEVAVVEDRERRGPEALVRHAVLEDQARRAEPRRQPALEAQVLAEEPACRVSPSISSTYSPPRHSWRTRRFSAGRCEARPCRP